MCPGLSSIIFCPPIFWYIFFFGVQAADGGLDFKVIPPTASPSEQSTSTGKENQNKQKISKIFINMHNNIPISEFVSYLLNFQNYLICRYLPMHFFVTQITIKIIIVLY